MLALYPNCKLCDRDLPPASQDARICSYECTYCASCVDTILLNVCPTCGGGFTERPIRPAHSKGLQDKLTLTHRPATTERPLNEWTQEQIKEISERLKDIEPFKR